MATAVIVGAVVQDAVGKLSDVIVDVVKTTSKFKSKFTQIQETIAEIKPILNEIERLNNVLDRPREETDEFIRHLERAQDLVRKCERIKWNFFKRYTHVLKLDGLNASLVRFFQINVQLQQARDTRELLVVVKDVQKGMEGGSSGGRSSGVPLLKGVVIGFDDRVRALKAMVLKDSAVDDCSVVVVSAAGGCGKTTLVTMLCHDPEIQGKFGKNIYFATISNTPNSNLKIVIKNLLRKNQVGQQPDFTSVEDATRQWGSFLSENKAEILLVLDDVWSVSTVNEFKFKLPRYKILVTSRFTFTQFNSYELQLLKDEDAANLFRHSAFSESGNERTDIPDDLVDKLTKCCKKHPLALSVIGGLLKGTHVASWHGMLNKLSEGLSVFDLDEAMLLRLARSLDVFEKESVIKQCYLDLGLFPEDQKIPAKTLMDMWVHLYKYDEEGLATINTLFELSSKNLATLLPIRKDSLLIANYCEEKAVMQHDMMRMLAIHLSSQEPVEHRKRLIINADGQDLPQLPQTVNARLLSISTGERFASRWNDIQVPKVEVFVLNFMSKIYVLPQFIQSMERLKVLIITNNGFSFSELQNFPVPQYLSGLTSIRLEHVSITSISTSILELANLQKLSLIMCEIGNSFKDCTPAIPNKLTSLLEIVMDSCHDIITFPAMLCNLGGLRKLSITNCLELSSLSEGFGNLTNLEVLQLASCSNLTAVPESMRNLQKLRVIDLSHCLHLRELPVWIGELGSLRTIHMSGCTGLHELPLSVKDLCPLEVVCDQEISLLWKHLRDVNVQVVEEDILGTFSKIVGRDYQTHHFF